jgi:hypothetical protein
MPPQKCVCRRPVAVGHQGQKSISIGVLMRHGKLLVYSLTCSGARESVANSTKHARISPKTRPLKAFELAMAEGQGAVVSL